MARFSGVHLPTFIKNKKDTLMQTIRRLNAVSRALALGLLFATTSTAFAADGTPVQGGTLIYLEQQAHTNLYPPAGGFYPNGGILNQITDKLTYQNPQTLV